MSDDGVSHMGQELGMACRRAGEELHGEAAVTPEMAAPGTDVLRLSILAAWADQVAGLKALEYVAPRVSVTHELSVDLYGEPVPERVGITARVLKTGRSVVVIAMDVLDGEGAALGVATATFMASHDGSITPRPLDEHLRDAKKFRQELRMPYAQRAGCVRAGWGVATLPRSEDGLNSSNTINGGLLALAAEEAVLSLTSSGTLLSLSMRYLRPARVGPVVAMATLREDFATVELRDAGSAERLIATATARVAPGRDD